MCTKEKDEVENDSASLEIAKLCKGLIYVSETDAPVELFVGERMSEISAKQLVYQLQLPKNTKIDQQDAPAFFKRLSEQKDWYTKDQKETARRFEQLGKIFSRRLLDPTVFRIGQIRIDIYAIGEDKNSGEIVGIRTRAVET
ncbi:nuclease A inhibitor family protein [Leptolyngbya sp. 7M]|uniref:nuclease A inhibitor family protein n=1 Tax=Leptolyngbya sp. 7M TaxID=2812896 RepID=UPI001B8B0D16|nr:nuclease A inhibitor family protein [Leptolyngbya sp. 7M]QYO65911.1 nuclease A inhibitor family protein [Leptolyngbya sp. 7M]